MKKSEITVGGKYIAKISGRLVTVKVDAIREVSRYVRNNYSGASETRDSTVYDVVNLSTMRKVTFRSAAKFRRSAERELVQSETVRERLTKFYEETEVQS